MLCLSTEDNNIYRIYDIVYPKTGFPNFLFYDGQQWRLRSAKYFIPLDEIELVEDEECDDDYGDGFFRDDDDENDSTFSYGGFDIMS